MFTNENPTKGSRPSVRSGTSGRLKVTQGDRTNDMDKMLYGQNGIRTKKYGQNGIHVQNCMDKKVFGQNGMDTNNSIEQNGMDKIIVRIKW